MNSISSKTSVFVLILILVASFILTFTSSLGESAVMDELAHIPAGYGYVKYFDYRLNPEHPPLIKAISALPLAFMDLNFPTNSPDWTTEINGQWNVGNQFIYKSGNDADKIVNWSRLGPILLFLILILFTYAWAKEVMGQWWALIPAFLVAFSPNFLAHSHYVTTDIGASLAFFISIYYFVKYYQNPSKKTLIFAGVAFGLAQLLKFSVVLVIPLFIVVLLALSLAKAISNNPSFIAKLVGFFKEAVKNFASLILVFIIGAVVIYAVYFVFTLNYPMEKQFSDTKAILTSFGGGPGGCPISGYRDIEKPVAPGRCLADLNISATQNNITRPFAQYVLGVLMVTQRASGGNTAFFMGEVSASGWWYYFPLVFVLKEPLPVLIFVALALFLASIKFVKKFRTSGLWQRFTNFVELNLAEFSMLSFIAIYWLYSIKSPLNIGVRHVLPTFPFIYILATLAIKHWMKNHVELSSGFLHNISTLLRSLAKNSAKAALVGFLLIWLLVETLISYPYFLSYFNEIGGTTMGGYKYVTDSNYDWGQDLKRLDKFVEKNGIDKIAIDYFGGADPKYYMPGVAEYWNSAKGDPRNFGIDWIAISVNSLQSAIAKTSPDFQRNPQDEYRWLTGASADVPASRDVYNPDYRIGTTIFVYKLK